MTQEEKQLLLLDLCARLPHGVYVKYENDGFEETREMGLGTLHDFMFGNADVKPYLRTMSSMTEEEQKDWHSYSCVCWNNEIDGRTYEERKIFSQSLSFDWLNAHHFDHRGLIDKGLALEAPEGMYNTKN